MFHEGLEGQDIKDDNQRKNGTKGVGLHHQEEKAYVVGTCGYNEQR